MPPMPAVQLGALLALALAASAHDPVAGAGRPPTPTVLGALPPAGTGMMGAIPPPPGKVVLETKTYGTVTVDHAGHLARRTACRSCHGDGPVSKIGFTPRQAHETCRACHMDLQRGPTTCRGCHVLPERADVTVAAQAAGASPAEAGATTGAPGKPFARDVQAPPPLANRQASLSAKAVPAVALATPGPGSPAGLPPPPPPPSYVGDLEDEPEGELLPFRRTVEAGMIVLSGPGQSTAVGPSLRLTSRYGRAVMVHSLDSAGGFETGRNMLMVGGGVVMPVRPRLAVLLVGIGGIDAVGSDVWLLPAAGVRVGLQWTRILRYLDTVSATVSGVSDLIRRRNDFGEEVGGVTFAFTLSAGLALDRGR